MRLATAKRTPRIVAVFFALTFVVFTCVFPYNVNLNNPNENVRIYMTMAIVEEGTFVIDKIVARTPAGWVNDMAVVPDPVTGLPNHYSVKGPAMGYLGVPVYWAFTKVAPLFGHAIPTVESPLEEKVWWLRASTVVLRLFLVQLPCFAFLVWLERWLRGTTKDTVIRLACVAAAGLGTNYLAYSLMFVSHALFAVAAFMSFGIITRERLLHRHHVERRRLSRAFAAGALAGFASCLDYQAFPISVLLALYALTTFWRPTRLAAFGLGAMLNAGALMFYQWKCYGDPLTPGHKLVDNPQFAAWHAQGFFGLGAPSFEVFRDLSLSRTFGFFGTSPFMWLGLLAIPLGIFAGYGPAWERQSRRVATSVWVLMMFTLWFAISCAVNWRGGWTVGPRFFGCAPPFFAFGAACALEWLARRGILMRAVARAAAGGLALASVVQTGFVSLVFNSIPEDVTRPLPQLAIPLARTGFVPHHAGELFGWFSPIGWYVVALCMLGATALVALWPVAGERLWAYAARLVLVPIVCVFALLPAFSAPDKEELGGEGVPPRDAFVRNGFARDWEPKDRDFLTELRNEAERYGKRRPCVWFRLADLERVVERNAEADQDELRAGAPRTVCP